MILIYSFGVAFILSALFGFLVFFFTLKQALNVEFVPKVEKKEERVNPAEVERLIVKFFEREEKKESVQIAKQETLPSPTDLNLKGIILSESLRGAVFGNGKEKFVEEGESIKGYTLKRVLPNGVLLSAGGKEYFLEFKPKKGKGGINTRRVSVSQSAFSKEVVISRREVEAITRDPAKMFTQIRLVPYVKGGKTEGFIFEWVKPGSIFHKLGIRRGDILVSINNMTITSGEDAFRILQMLRNEPNLKIVLIRGGKKEEINVRIE
ncbi:type II secretion system protein GspC [Aquifex sp.]